MTHDNPLNASKDDQFCRSGFALRIPSIIKNRTDREGIVLGINGKWGEGKTSVWNFISEDLLKLYPKIIVVKFNPWRFSEESKLLESYDHVTGKILWPF